MLLLISQLFHGHTSPCYLAGQDFLPRIQPFDLAKEGPSVWSVLVI